ncbi:MAG: LysM domain-containing protein [Thermoactinomyces sp.]
MKIHIARSGETLSDIAQKYNITLERLQELNPDLSTTERLNSGEKVRVPTGKIALAVSGNNEKNSQPDLNEESGCIKYEEYPENNETAAEPLPKQLPKPPSIEDLRNWSEMMDSSSMLDHSSVHENLDTSYDSSYPEMPPESFSNFPQGNYMPPPPQFFGSAYNPVFQGWMPAPCYFPPAPMGYPGLNSFNPPPAVPGPNNDFAVKYREWKESSSSEG